MSHAPHASTTSIPNKQLFSNTRGQHPRVSGNEYSFCWAYGQKKERGQKPLAWSPKGPRSGQTQARGRH